MLSRKLVQRTNASLIRFDFFYTYSWVNGLCFGYFQIFRERSPFDLKITLTLTPFPYVRRLLDLRVRCIHGAIPLCESNPANSAMQAKCKSHALRRGSMAY